MRDHADSEIIQRRQNSAPSPRYGHEVLARLNQTLLADCHIEYLKRTYICSVKHATKPVSAGSARSPAYRTRSALTPPHRAQIFLQSPLPYGTPYTNFRRPPRDVRSEANRGKDDGTRCAAEKTPVRAASTLSAGAAVAR